MNDKKRNKIYTTVKCLTYISIVGLSYLKGRNIQSKIFNDRLDYMARTGATISNFVDGKAFTCSVTETK